MVNHVLGFSFFDFLSFIEGIYVEMLIAPIITVFYFIKEKRKSLLFSLFMLVYSIADLINFFDQESFNEAVYFVCNALYMLSYLFLLLEMAKTVSFTFIIKKLPIHLIVLTLLNVYMMYVMVIIINPILFETNHLIMVQAMEQMYNVFLLAILSLSFLNYIINESSKTLLLFFACLTITFSEFLLIGYFYLSGEMLQIRYSAVVLELSAFLLFYFHATKELNPTEV